MAKKMKDPQTEVAEYLKHLTHPLLPAIHTLREIVSATDPSIEEQIKWNSPCFFYNGPMKPFDPKEYKRDIVVFNLHRQDYILLVFPTGAKINDATGLLEGSFKDGRRVCKFLSAEEVENKKDHLQTVIRSWLSAIND